jgi:hypothetical protein
MDRLASNVSAKEVPFENTQRTDLLHEDRHLSWQDLNLSDHDLVDYFLALRPEGERTKIKEWRSANKTDAEIADLIKKDLGPKH